MHENRMDPNHDNIVIPIKSHLIRILVVYIWEGKSLRNLTTVFRFVNHQPRGGHSVNGPNRCAAAGGSTATGKQMHR